MISQPHLLPECYGDTLLVDILLKETANHRRSVSQVFVALKDDFRKRRAVGIIDDDKKKDAYYNEFKCVESSDCFEYLKHPNKIHYLIVLKPALEGFLMKCGSMAGAEHHLLKDRKQMSKILKDINVSRNNEVRDLINILLQRKSAPLLRIQQLLSDHKI